MGADGDRDPRLAPAMRAEAAADARVTELVALAEAQHGRVHREQLLDLGFRSSAIGRLVLRGWLQREHTGVYVVGRRGRDRRGRWMGAVLAGGPGAALSHRAGGALYRVRPAVARIDVTAPTRRTSRGALRFHECDLPADERDVIDGIPVTSILRTLLDLAASEGPATCERAAHEAEARRIGDPLGAAAFLERHRGERGVGIMRDVLVGGRLGLDLTESELEDAFVAFLDEQGLPRARLNDWIGPYRCDASWPHAKLAVELDSRRWHATTGAFESDRIRDRRLRVAGWHTVRVTARQLREDRATLAEDLRMLLGPRAGVA